MRQTIKVRRLEGLPRLGEGRLNIVYLMDEKKTKVVIIKL